MGPKGGDTVETTSKTETNYPQWSQDALKNLVGLGGSMNGPFLQTPNFGLAGMNPDQLKAFDLARQSAQGAFTGGQTQVSGNGIATAARVGPMAQGSVTNATAAQVDPSKIGQGMNPYLKAVLAPAMQQAARSRDSNQAAIGTRAAASGSFGGSREAIERGQADRAYQESTATMVAQLMSRGWDQASALAQANAQMQQQTNLTNAGAANDMSQFNTSAQNAGTLAQAGYDQQAGMFNAGMPLEMAQVQDRLTDSNFQRQQSALATLLGLGNQQQQFGQSALDYPFTALQRLAALTPQQLNSVQNQTGTAPNTAPSPFQSLLGGAMTIGGMAVGGPAGGSAGSLLGNFLSKKG